MSESAGKILIIRGGAIGDFILTLPVLSALRQTFPETQLAILGYPNVAKLAAASVLASEVRSIEAGPLAGFFAERGTLDPAFCDFFSEFALIISYLYDPDEIFRRNLQRCSKAQFLQGPHRPLESEQTAACKVFLKPLEKLGIFEASPVPELSLPGESRALGAGNWIAVHPGSGSPKKNWPLEKWHSLLSDILSQTPVNLLLVGGPAEAERVDALATMLPRSRAQVAQNKPLLEVAQLLKGCAGFLGHDSGISHLAGALRIPGLLLWGPSNAIIWRPPFSGLELLQTANLEDLPVQTVLAKALEFIERTNRPRTAASGPSS